MNLRFTTCPVSASSVWMVCACAPTSTVWLCAPTFNVRFVVAFWLTSTLNGALAAFAKPFASTVIEYKPGATERKR